MILNEAVQEDLKVQDPAFTAREASLKGDTVLELNENVIKLLIAKQKSSDKYPISRVIDIIHRTIPDSELNMYGYKEQRFIRRPSDISLSAVISGEFRYKHMGNEIVYEDIVLPGLDFRDSFCVNLQNSIDAIEWETLELDKIIEYAAVYCIALVAAHIELDGNLRTGVGLSKFIIDSKTNRKLSIEKLNSRKVELKELLDTAIIWLLPEELRPDRLIEGSNKKNHVNIYDHLNSLDASKITDELYRSGYFDELQENISTLLDGYNVDPDQYYRDRGELLGIKMGQKTSNLEIQKISERLRLLFLECLH